MFNAFKDFFGLFLTCLFLTACGGSGGSGTTDEIAATQPVVEAPPQSSPVDDDEPTTPGWTFNINDYVGSLYRAFPWSGPIRDPFRDQVEIQDPALFSPLSPTDLTDIADMLRERDIIMQIGGMGSAKLNHDDPSQPNPSFVTYMDNVIADGGQQWRDAVKTRVREISDATSNSGHALYWQIGNEINAASYLSNIRLYFGDDSLQIIPVYVEYFLAPTLAAIQEAEAQGGADIHVALGSIAGFSNDRAVTFVNDLLNYSIQGDMAASLAGRKVHELIDLLTVHYHFGAGTQQQPSQWQEHINQLQQQWVRDNIVGIWTTEEVGIQAAERGDGAAGALRVFSHFVSWVHDNDLSPTQGRVFYYGTEAGPAGQRISDAMDTISTLTNGQPITGVKSEFLQDSQLEITRLEVEGAGLNLLIIAALGDEPVMLENLNLGGFGFEAQSSVQSAWLYNNDSATEIFPEYRGGELLFTSVQSLGQPDVIFVALAGVTEN